MLRTRLTEQYKLQHPLVLAGMGFVSMPELVAAVSNAGGLGVLGTGAAPPPALQAMVRQIKAQTSRPFGVNFIVETIALGPCTVEEHIEICVSERVGMVVFFWNFPPASWVERLHAARTKVWIQVGSVEAARKAAATGMDAVIIQGREAGGHNKSSGGLFALLPAAVDAVAPMPVIAAGGIADGRGVAATLALGADGVCVGTRLLASREAWAHPEYKQRVVRASVEDIARTPIFGPEWPDQPMMVIRNRVVAEWGHSERTPTPPSSPQVIGHTKLAGQDYSMPKFSAILPTPETTGDFEEMCLAAGESAGLVHEVRPAADIVRQMMEEAEGIIRDRFATVLAPSASAGPR
jgi:enoyl-[acyl-carrier protein] reductase II